MPKIQISLEVRELEVIVETLEHRARMTRHEGISSAWSMAAQDIRDLLQRHDVLREPTEPTNGDD